MGRIKTFLDSVHGYIAVPEEYCDNLIDTVNFQRLRRIEQLSSRSLFPCARHDRFVHSLGVYHIGKKFTEAIKERTPNVVADKLETTFLIACLLHDVGHSPFSHTLEEYFGEKDYLIDIYKDKMKRAGLQDEELENIVIEKTDVKQHEILSALLCITTYLDAIRNLGGDPLLAGRMIMGFYYQNDEKSLENCFISLLHGDVIDADKLDYVCRDRWASGYQNNPVDVERIIRSVVLFQQGGKYCIAYSKNALYEIQALIDNKNFQSNWVFKHHQVVYEQKIFRNAISELVECMQADGKMDPRRLFNYESFFKQVEVCPGASVYMLSDDDIIHLMKVNQSMIPHFKEWMSRNYEYAPIWKTYSEMVAMLGNDISDRIMKDEKNLYEEIVNFLKEKHGIEAFLHDSTPSIKMINKGQVLIYYNENNIVDFTTLGMPERYNNYQDRTFQYIFVQKILFEKDTEAKNRLINDIQSYVKSRQC